ncbi:MAG: UvrABC system protein B, partial [Parcubacteria group bacterium GW2011_GWC1_39_29]
QEVIRVKFKNDRIDKIFLAHVADPEDMELTDLKYEHIIQTNIFPAKYWITSDDKVGLAIENIKSELQQTIKRLKKDKKLEEAFRLQAKTDQDIEMMRQTGYCHGIENYSRHLDFRKAGAPPYSLLDFFKSKGEFLTIIDESHKRIQKSIYVSATPGKHEIEKAGPDNVAEQLVRPTGLLDPTIEIHPTKNQIAHLLENIKDRVSKNERILVTTLTKRMAEDLSEHLAEQGIKVNYLHSEIKTLDRIKILKDLRLGHHDVIVGVNLLREGLDLPEVSLIAILDADKEGFLRNYTTLIQTMGRAARNVNGHVIMYADKITKSIDNAVKEVLRRRKTQEIYNTENSIIPTTIIKEIGSFDLPISRNAANNLGNDNHDNGQDIINNRISKKSPSPNKETKSQKSTKTKRLQDSR